MVRKAIRILMSVIGGVVLVAASAPAYGGPVNTFEFARLSSNADVDVAPYITLTTEATAPTESTDNGTQVWFTFANDAPFASSITGVYLDDRTGLLTLPQIFDGDGVDFNYSWKKFPGGAGMDPPFITSRGLTVRSEPPVSPDGVNPGESLLLLFGLNGDYADLISAIGLGAHLQPGDSADGTLRIGLHVQAVLGDESDVVRAVPVPNALLLGSTGLGLLLGATRLRRHRRRRYAV